MISIDTETTGTDVHHGCIPFAVSAATEEQTYCWEWEIDPFTRLWKKKPPQEDKREIRQLIKQYDEVWFHNSKFDLRFLATLGIRVPWEKVHDTTILSHVLHNLWPKNLKRLAKVYLMIGDTDESAIRDATIKARRHAKREDWDLARYGHPMFPAVSKNAEWWKMDMWMPSLVREQTDETDPLIEYATLDAIRTIGLAKALKRECEETPLLWEQYERKRELIRIFYEMETEGLLVRPKVLRTTATSLSRKISKLKDDLESTYQINPNSYKQVSPIIFGRYKLKPVKWTENGAPSTDKESIPKLLEQAEDRGHKNAIRFLTRYQEYKSLDKQRTYLDAYKLAVCEDYRIRSSANITGTSFTRQSYSDPNLQQIDEKLRHVFGPEEGYVWWANDYKNLELRIWATACGNQELMEAFDKDLSIHAIICRQIHPAMSGMSDEEVENTTTCPCHGVTKPYKRTKNGNFAKIYGGGDRKVDNTYGVVGANDLIVERFPEIRRFTDQLHKSVQQDGYISTRGGCRLYVPSDEPHKAVSAYVQGTAGEIMTIAMINVAEQYRLRRFQRFDIAPLLQIHDELVIKAKSTTPNNIRRLFTRAMERAGDEVDVRTPVDSQIIKTHWGE